MKVDNKTGIIGRLSLALALAALSALSPQGAEAKVNAVELTQKAAENQVRRLIEPVLDKYCRDECKLLSVSASVDIATPEELSPGFDETDSRAPALAASSAK